LLRGALVVIDIELRERAAPHERTLMKAIANVIESRRVWSWGGGSAPETSTCL
jgi:hypothetical protein